MKPQPDPSFFICQFVIEKGVKGTENFVLQGGEEVSEHCSVCKKKIRLEEAFKHDGKVVCRDCIKKMLSGFLSY